MAAIEKHIVQIFDAKKRIVDQARQESNLWEHHLLPKLILNGIPPPPPWLSNSSLHSFLSDPKDLNRDDIVSEGLLSQTQFGIPFTGRQCSLNSNLDDVQHQFGLRDEDNGFEKDHGKTGRLSNLPDCSVNNAGCVSSGRPELDSDAISPQNQIEPRLSDSCHDPAVSRAKLQRSRSRQKALELRNSGKASKRLSGDGDNAGECTAAATGSASPSLQENHIKDLSLVNEVRPNNQSCFTEEVRRGDCLTQKDPSSNYTGRITRSKSSSEKFNSLSVGSSSVEKEDGPPINDSNEVMELVNRASFINDSCWVQPLITKDLQDPSVAVVGSFGSQKELHISAVKTKEHLSRSSSGKTYLTRSSKSSKSPSSNSHEQSATHFESAGKKSQNVQPAKLDPTRLSSISVNSAEKENLAEMAASRNTRAVTSCTKEGPLRQANSSNLDGGSFLAESLYIKTAVAGNDLDVLVDKDPSCLVSRLTTISPKIREEVSVLRPSPDLLMSVMPKQLVFDDGEETNRDGISSSDLKDGCQRMSPDKEPPALSELLKLFDDDMQEVMGDSFPEAVTENGLPRHTDESVANFNVRFPFGSSTDESNVDLAQQAPYTISSGQNGHLLRQAPLSNGKVTSFSTDLHNFKSSTNNYTNDVDSCSQHKRRKIEIETQKFLPDSTHLWERLVDSIDQRPASRTSSIKEDNPEAVIEVQHLAFDQADDTGHECVSNIPTDVMEDTGESQKIEGSSCKFKEDNPEAVIEVQHLAFDQVDDTGHGCVSNIPTDVMEDTGESHKIEGSSCKVRKEKLVLDGRGRSSDSLMLPEANPFSFSIDSTEFTMEEMVGSQHLQVNSGEDIEEHQTCDERSTSSRRIYPGGDTEFLGGLSVCSGLRDLDLIGTGEALPEFERFIMQTDNAQSCTAQDKMELESMNLPSNSKDYTSHGRSRFMHSPSCYSSTPYRLRSLENLYRSLPNGLLEGYGLRSPPHLNDGSPRALSDCGPKCNDQFRSSVQTLWDRFNTNFGSSGKRKSSKPELPCISEENENVDEIAGTFHKGIGSEGMTGSITREPLSVIINNANPSTSVLQDALASGREDLVSSEFNFDGTDNKVKKKLDKQDGNSTRFTSKGKDNHSISLGANGAKRNSESVCKGSSRPKLSKYSMKQQRPTFSGGKSTRKNIVSNVTSFIPLVQQKQAAAGFTGKRDIKEVKALKAAAAAKDAAEKKENERKKKKEEQQIERMKKKKEEERKKEAEMPAKKRLRENEEKKKEEERKEAKMPAKKRQRENGEKKENQRKTKHVNDIKQQEKKKEELKVHWRATGEEVCESRTTMDGRDNHNNMLLPENKQGNAEKNSQNEPLAIRDSANHKTKESCCEKSESASECANKGKATMVDLIKAVEDNDLVIKNSLQEQSYEMSPYRSDDDEDEDDLPNHKFIPSWASKHSLSLIVSSQKVDPQTIFPRQSFCDIAKVLLPRKLQL